ncbi:beta-ketoacyl-ACP synthase II [Pendulispora albinea]|uniref:3-oxoacyl-[acyl-carrier-protein] synthase 2 n=1 Tax=Pendulispora albinea TaxID=2741071 RepID=A0ABZ2MB24_9BACT
MRRCVVTGVGMLTPCGATTEETWAALIAGQSGIASVPEWADLRFPRGKLPVTIAGRVPAFDPLRSGMTAKDTRRTDLFQQYALAASHQAWQQASLPDRLEGELSERAAAIFGVGFGGFHTIVKQHDVLRDGGPSRISAFSIPSVISNGAPGNIAIRYNLRGPNWAVTSACASSAHALGEAFLHIAYGRIDLAVTGGSEACATPLAIAGFASARTLTTSHNHEPERASRPFERHRDGFVLGEGAGALVLEELEHAKRRGAVIFAEVVGYGSTCDASHSTMPSQGGDGAARAMRQALSMAKMAPDEIGYLNAHGTSTVASDRIETDGIKAALGPHAKDRLMISSTKSMTGHMLGAAGAVEAAISVLALTRGVLPPTINYDEPDPECDLDYIPNTLRERPVNAVMSNCFGFGGTNASLLFRRFTS